jgi:hypothetical protein
MGTEAREFVQTQKAPDYVKYSYLPHPSYLKRFKGNNPSVMAEMIRSTIDGTTNTN